LRLRRSGIQNAAAQRETLIWQLTGNFRGSVDGTGAAGVRAIKISVHVTSAGSGSAVLRATEIVAANRRGAFGLFVGPPQLGVFGYPDDVSPTVLRVRGFRFYFFSREEPRMHVHVHHANGGRNSGSNRPWNCARRMGSTHPA
jgi:hypothetical protein